MKRISKKIAVLLILVLSTGLIGGCGKQFDAAAYVKALLDNSYKNDSTAFVEQKLGTAEDAAEIYNQGLEHAISDILIDEENESFSVSEDLLKEYRNTFETVFSKVSYTVGEAEKQEDGSYVVTVSYETMDVFSNAMEDYDVKVAEWTEQLSADAIAGEAFPEEEELYNTLFVMLKDCINDAAANVGYSEPQEMTVRVELSDGVYAPNQSDIEALEYHLLGLYK